MGLTRRTFVKFGILLTGSIGGISLFHYFDPRRRKFEQQADTFTLYLDALIPAYDGTPSASDVNIPNRLLQAASLDRRYSSLLTRGIKWLEDTARQRFENEFSGLDQDELDALIKLASQFPPRSIPWRFFQKTRDDAFKLYYSDPQVLAQFGITRPPQPLGYPDHDRAPV